MGNRQRNTTVSDIQSPFSTCDKRKRERKCTHDVAAYKQPLQLSCFWSQLCSPLASLLPLIESDLHQRCWLRRIRSKQDQRGCLCCTGQPIFSYTTGRNFLSRVYLLTPSSAAAAPQAAVSEARAATHSVGKKSNVSSLFPSNASRERESGILR